MRPVMAAVAVMVALSICVFTLVKVYRFPAESPVSQLTPAGASVPSPGQPPGLPELSEQTRRQLEAPVRPGPVAPQPDAQATVPDPSPDGRSRSGGSPDANSSGAGSSGSRSTSSNEFPGRPSRPLSPNALPRGTGPGAQDRSGAAANPDSPAPDSPAPDSTARGSSAPDRSAPDPRPEVIYIPETPEERDARMRRELADSVCDQYGVQREACRARTARR